MNKIIKKNDILTIPSLSIARIGGCLYRGRQLLWHTCPATYAGHTGLTSSGQIGKQVSLLSIQCTLKLCRDLNTGFLKLSSRTCYKMRLTLEKQHILFLGNNRWTFEKIISKKYCTIQINICRPMWFGKNVLQNGKQNDVDTSKSS